MARYVLLERIGQGGMAEVFRARAAGSDGFARTCAVKRLLPEFEDDPSIRTRFLDEARIARGLRHPCIVGVFDYYEDAGRPHLVMEFIEGLCVADLLQQARAGRFIPLQVTTRVVQDVARALEHAHQAGVLHRDVSSTNVLVSRRGEVKLTDFGIATARERLSVSEPGAVFGNPAYLSPSRRAGAPATPADDLYALGVILGELIRAADPRERARAEGQRLHELQTRLLGTRLPRLESAATLVAELGRLEPSNNRSLVALVAGDPARTSAAPRPSFSAADFDGDTYPEGSPSRPHPPTRRPPGHAAKRAPRTAPGLPLRRHLALAAAALTLAAGLAVLIAHLRSSPHIHADSAHSALPGVP